MTPKQLWSIRWQAMLRRYRKTGIHYPKGILLKEAVRVADGLNKIDPDYVVYRVVPAELPDKEG